MVGFPRDVEGSTGSGYKPSHGPPAAGSAKSTHVGGGDEKVTELEAQATEVFSAPDPAVDSTGGVMVDPTVDPAVNPETAPAPKKRRRAPWGGKDWAGKAVSTEVLEEVKSTAGVWGRDPDGRLIGEDGNHFFCRC